VKIYTKTGDEGETVLFDNTRISKADARVDAYGEIDELNASLGAARAVGLDRDLDMAIGAVQGDLMAAGARLADPDSRIARRVEKVTIDAATVARLEGVIDALDRELPVLTSFILPGGTLAAAQLHMARVVCRRVERRVIALAGPIDPVLIAYLNRLSDLLFTMARAANRRAGHAETEW
jgi:cob(I)alamin adenosyltransferase